MQTFRFFATLAVTVGLAVSPVGAQVLIDMPAPSRKAAAAAPMPQPAARVSVEPGELALARYARARRGPRDTYRLGRSRRYGYPYYGYPYYGSGFWWPWFGHHHHHFVIKTPK